MFVGAASFELEKQGKTAEDELAQKDEDKPLADDPGGIEVTFVEGYKKEDTQIFHKNQWKKSHVTAPGKRPGINMNRKRYKDDDVE